MYPHHLDFKMEDFMLWLSLANIIILQGHVVTLEITSGQVYRGKLLEGALPVALGLVIAHVYKHIKKQALTCEIYS